MGRTVEEPCKHIVSFRINNHERELLEKWSHDSGMSVSTMMRKMFIQTQDSFKEILQQKNSR